MTFIVFLRDLSTYLENTSETTLHLPLTCFLTLTSNGRKDSPNSATSPTFSSPRPGRSQEITPLLLLSMFAIAARYTEDTMTKPQDGKMWDAGCDYLERARQLLGKRTSFAFNPLLIS